MSRRIITEQLQAGGGGPTVDTYFDKVIKNIPADIVGAWTAVSGLVLGAASSVPKNTVLWIAFAVGILLTALWTLKQTQQPNMPPATKQTIISTGAFFVWVFALGGPFAGLAWYNPLYGSLLLIAYTLVVALL
jgi:hypothetical protein